MIDMKMMYLVLKLVKDYDITELRIDRYDGFLFDDFEISKYWNISKQIETVTKFINETTNYKSNFNYSLFFTNEYGLLIYRLFNTLEQVFEDNEDIDIISDEEMIFEALEKRLITFKQYNTYMKNHEGK